MKKHISFYAGIASLIILISSCSRDDDELIVHDMEPGTFEATITGDVESSFEGVAIYTEYMNQVTGEFFFTIGLGSTTDEAISLWFVRGGEYPGEGTYNIQSFERADLDDAEWFFEPQDFVNLGVRQPGQEVELYFSQSGSITFEPGVENTIAGEFEFTATGSHMNQENQGEETGETDPAEEVWEIVISGTFNAAFGEVPLPAF
jgi:hypothetical protein